MTRWERAVEAAAQQLATEIPDKWKRMSQISKDYWCASAAAALRAALPALFEARQWEGWDSFADALAINEYRIWLDAHRLALEAEASHE